MSGRATSRRPTAGAAEDVDGNDVVEGGEIEAEATEEEEEEEEEGEDDGDNDNDNDDVDKPMLSFDGLPPPAPRRATLVVVGRDKRSAAILPANTAPPWLLSAGR